MRNPKRSLPLLYGLLLPILVQLLALNTSVPDKADNFSAPDAIFGCAGSDATLDICTFCEAVDLEVDFLASLNDSPRSGGTWTDLDNSGLDLTNPTAVNVAGLGTGIYRFRYNTAAGGACPADAAVLTLNVTGSNTIACVDQVNAVLQADCTYEITVDKVLSGEVSCEEELSVLAFDFETGFNGSILTEAQTGKLLDVVLFKEGCPQPICNSTILLEDKGTPNLTEIDWLADDITLYCEDLNRIVNNDRTWQDPDYKYYLGGPLVNDCSGVFVSVTDNVIYAPCGGSAYATLQRTFIATDISGNFSSVTLEAEFIYPEIDKIVKLPDIVINSCSPEGIPIPATYPYLINSFGDTIYLKEDGCDYSIGFEDRDFIVCGGSKKVEREIRYFDWCTDQFFPIDTVVIKIGDFTGPTIERKKDTVVIPTSPFSCGGFINLDRASIEALFEIVINDCNPNVRLTGHVESYLPTFDYQDTLYQEGEALHHDTYIDHIPPGLHRFVVNMSDGCKSEATDTIYFRVADQVPPVMACIDRLLVSMSEGPYGKVTFADINEGSSDNCAIDRLKVRRQVPSTAYKQYDYDQDGIILGDELDMDGYTRFDDPQTQGDFIEYFCNDLMSPEQPIELWGWDAQGNVNTCWTTVVLEDKLPPVCIAPKDTVVACYDYVPIDLAQFGQPELSDYSCGQIQIETLPAIETLDQCGQGTIVRQFQAIKSPGTQQARVGPVCVQTVTILSIQDYNICFPADTTLDCGLALEQMEPVLESNGCALFAVNYEDIKLEAQNDACYKVIRTYSVINWCEYEADNPFIHIGRDIDDDNAPGDEGVCVLVRPNGLTYLDRNTDPTDTIPNFKGYWVSSGANPNLASTGYWRYTQHIKVQDTTPPVLSFPDSLVFESRYEAAEAACFGVATIPFTIEETCDSFIQLQVSLNLHSTGKDYVPLGNESLFGSFPNFEVMTDFPLGAHQIRVEASDGCGNTAILEIPFEVVDRKAPAPICGDMLAVELSFFETEEELSALATARVDALLRSPIYDCNGQGPDGLITDYSINRSDSAVVRGQRELRFDCNDADEFVKVEVHAWDEAGNQDFCTTYIHVQDNNAVCQQLLNSGVISGSIQTPEGRMVEDVMVALSGEMEAFYATSSAGDFLFEALPSGKSYNIRPAKDNDVKNGVSTLDLIKVQKHVLGAQPITDPYRLIAADVNNSQSVTTLDMIQLRKIILNVDDHFRNNTSWRFIEANYQFPDETNPWKEPFPESKQLTEMQGPANVHFVGIKIGDVNGNAVANQVDGATVSRSAGQLQFRLMEKALTKGEVIAVPIRVENMQEIQGFQGTLAFDTEKLRFLTMNYGLLEAGQVGHFEADHRLSFSWNRSQEDHFANTEVLLTVYFQAETNLYLSNSIQLNSSLTKVEAYNIFEEPLELSLLFESPEQSQHSWELFPNQPNPFREQTYFPLYLEEGQRVQMQLYDMSGRKIWSAEEEYMAGLQQIQLPASIFPARGIYYFQLQIDGTTQTRTILLE